MGRVLCKFFITHIHYLIHCICERTRGFRDTNTSCSTQNTSSTLSGFTSTCTNSQTTNKTSTSPCHYSRRSKRTNTLCNDITSNSIVTQNTFTTIESITTKLFERSDKLIVSINNILFILNLTVNCIKFSFNLVQINTVLEFIR